MGGYDETEMFAEDVGEYMRRGLVNIVGEMRHDAAHIAGFENACNYNACAPPGAAPLRR